MSKVFVITGANRGIGFALVQQLSDKPDTIVIATARKPQEAKELQEWIKTHPNVHAVSLEMGSESSIFAAAEEVEKLVGGIDVLVANAAICYSYTGVLQCSTEAWNDHWNINIIGTINVCKAFYPLLLKRETRKIALITSFVSSMGDFFHIKLSAYSTSKAALNFVAKELSSELDPEQFTVISLNPGHVLSDMGQRGKDTIDDEHPDLVEKFEFITTEQSARAQIQVLEGLTRQDNGKCLHYDGTTMLY